MKALHTGLAAAAILATFGFAQSASALSSTYAASVDGGPTAPNKKTELTGSVDQFAPAIPLFNQAAVAAANPGFNVTLTDVKVTYQVGVTITGTLLNNASQAQTFKYDENLTGYLDGNSANTPAPIGNTFGVAGTLPFTVDFGNTTYSAVPAGNSVTYPPSSAGAPVTTGGFATFTGGDASAFIGTGSFTVGLTTLTGQAVSGGGGNIQNNLVTKAGGLIAVVYSYTLSAQAVPEPTTIALLGAGLVGLGLIRRRKNG